MRYTKILTAITALFIVSACAVNASFNTGALLTVDESGHLKVTAVYDYGYAKITFAADGTYTKENFHFETATDDIDGDGVTNEGWIQDSGDKGTYVYDPEQRKMTIEYSQYYLNEWLSITNQNDTVHEEFSGLLTENMMMNNYNIYNFDSGNRWKSYDNTVSYNDAQQAKTYYYTVDTTAGTVAYESQQISYNANGAMVNSSRSLYIYKIVSTKPDGIEWKKGNTLAFALVQTDYCFSSTNNGTSWTPYASTNHTYSSTTKTMLHNDTFMIYDPYLIPGEFD